MKNKLLITTALASSLVAGSALAQTAITGSLTASYKSVQGKNNSGNGNSFGKESQINVSNKGKLNIGGLSYAAGFSLEFDGADGIYSYNPNITTTTNASASAVTLVNSVSSTARQTGTGGWHLENNYIDIINENTGTTLTISSDHIQNARGGLANIVGQHAEDFSGGVAGVNSSLAMDYAGTAVAESFGIGIVQNVGKLGKVSYLYVPNNTGGSAINSTRDATTQAGGVVEVEGDAVLGSDNSPTAYEYGFIGDLGVKGLTVKAFKTEEGLKHTFTTKNKGQNLGIRYTHDIFTVGVNQMKQKAGGNGTHVQTKQMEYGLGLAVNKDLSVGLYMNKSKRDGVADDETTRSIAVGYSLGPVALSAQYGRVDSLNGTAANEANVLYMALTTAF
jgi:hypothetical protein